MLDIKKIRDNPSLLSDRLSKRDLCVNFTEIIQLDETLRNSITEAEHLKNSRNTLSNVIARENPDKNRRLEIIAEVKEVNQKIKGVETNIHADKANLYRLLLELPNVPADDVPKGTDESDNVLVETWGTPRVFDFDVKDHIELGERKKMLDFVTGSKLSGSRYTLLRNRGAQMERALINFMLDTHTGEHGYDEVMPPYILNESALVTTGQLPKFENDLFKTDDHRFLIPTAEVPLTNIQSHLTTPAESFPMRSTAYTACFRKEAGSYGKDVKGYLRQHQFNKVELVWHTLPEQSEDAHQQMLTHAKTILERLELPYRVMLLCGGDMGFSAKKCYDIEVWLPGQNKYREISSCSNCGDFQARRGNMKYKNKHGKTEFIHTLNGSGLAIGRTLIAIMENCQTAAGNIRVPAALKKYMCGLTEI